MKYSKFGDLVNEVGIHQYYGLYHGTTHCKQRFRFNDGSSRSTHKSCSFFNYSPSLKEIFKLHGLPKRIVIIVTKSSPQDFGHSYRFQDMGHIYALAQLITLIKINKLRETTKLKILWGHIVQDVGLHIEYIIRVSGCCKKWKSILGLYIKISIKSAYDRPHKHFVNILQYQK